MSDTPESPSPADIPEPTRPADTRTFPRDGGRTPRTKRLMVVLGGVTLLVLVIVNARAPHPDNASLWPLLLGGVAALYLWWLGTLLFDLVFVWHRYIQGDVAMKFLRKQDVQRLTADDDGPDDRPHGSIPVALPPQPPATGPAIQPRPIERGYSEGAGTSA